MTPHQIREFTAAGALAGVLALSGCGSEKEVASSTPTVSAAPAATREAPAALPDDLRGSWKRTMTARDWRAAGTGYPVGTWRVDIDARGEASVYLPHTDTVDFTPRLAVKGRHLTIQSVPVCPGETGHYTWRVSGGALRLAAVGGDACRQGAALFGGTWTRRH